MRTVLLLNPRSGAGRAAALAARAEAALQRDGHACVRLSVGEARGLVDALSEADALVVIGGDGTVHHALPALLAASGDARAAGRLPPALYHLPTGTENLVARELGHTARAGAVARALAAGRRKAIDLGVWRCGPSGPRPFVLMASTGPDASIVERRGSPGRSGRASYAWPIVRELLRPRLANVRVTVDGVVAVADGTGQLVVANSGRYALGHDPARAARVDDGRLDVVFLPARGRWSMLRWSWRCRRGTHMRDPGVVYASGACVEVSPLNGAGTPWQIDGEPVSGAAGTVTLGVLPGAIEAWLPAAGT